MVLIVEAVGVVVWMGICIESCDPCWEEGNITGLENPPCDYTAIACVLVDVFTDDIRFFVGDILAEVCIGICCPIFELYCCIGCCDDWTIGVCAIFDWTICCACWRMGICWIEFILFIPDFWGGLITGFGPAE